MARRSSVVEQELVPVYDRPPHVFRSTLGPVEVLRSAFKHEVPEEDMQHAVRSARVVEEIGDDPVRYLVLGPDRAGNLLELVVLDRPQGPAIIHAMAMRPQYRGLLSRKR